MGSTNGHNSFYIIRLRREGPNPYRHGARSSRHRPNEPGAEQAREGGCPTGVACVGGGFQCLACSISSSMKRCAIHGWKRRAWRRHARTPTFPKQPACCHARAHTFCRWRWQISKPIRFGGPRLSGIGPNSWYKGSRAGEIFLRHRQGSVEAFRPISSCCPRRKESSGAESAHCACPCRERGTAMGKVRIIRRLPVGTRRQGVFLGAPALKEEKL